MSEHSQITFPVPSQQKFIDDFLQPGSPRRHLLVAPPGTGKTHAACLIVERLAATGQAKHVLVLAPAPLRAQWASVLRTISASASVVQLDRQTFRELQAAVPVGQLPWDRAPLVVTSLELLRHADVYDAVASQRWDLVIVDECHRIKVVADPRQGTKVDGAALLRHLIDTDRVQRLLMMTATPGAEVRYVPELAVTVWHFEPAPLRMAELLYSPAEDELRFVNALNEFLDRELVGGTADGVRENVRQHAESSIFSVEPALIAMRNDLAHNGNLPAGPVGSPGEGYFHAVMAPLPWRDRLAALPAIEGLLARLDEVRSDSKLRVFLQAVQNQRELHPNAPALCVVALYTRTASYLHSALTDVGVEAALVTSVVDRDRIAAVDEFRAKRGCLVVTYNGLKGLEIPDARMVIVYDDFPGPAFEQVVGRFNRYGRREPLTVMKLRRSSSKPVVE